MYGLLSYILSSFWKWVNRKRKWNARKGTIVFHLRVVTFSEGRRKCFLRVASFENVSIILNFLPAQIDCVRETSVKRRNKKVQEITQNVANVFTFYAIIGIKHGFLCIKILQVPGEMLKTEADIWETKQINYCRKPPTLRRRCINVKWPLGSILIKFCK